MKYCFLLILIFSFLLFIPFALSEKIEIHSLDYSPSEPVVLENMSISVGIQNNGITTENLKLKIFITKDGIIKHQTFFEFDLQPGKTVSFSFPYVPDDIAEHEILAKLYDKYETELYDSEILRFNVISLLGPFDLFLDIPTRTIKPGDELPVILRMVNNGNKGTDVKIRVEVLCVNQTLFYDFVIFLEPKSRLEKIISMPACKEDGLYTVSSNLILFNRSWISSMNQFFVNKTFFELTLISPETIEVERGESKTFDILVKNSADSNITNLILIIEKIPSEWYEIKPSLIKDVEPNEMVVFIVTLSIPEDASAKEYPVTFDAASNEVYKKENSVLKIFSLPIVPIAEVEIALFQRISQFVVSKKIETSLIIFSFIAIVSIIKVKKKVEARKFKKERKERFKKILKTIE